MNTHQMKKLNSTLKSASNLLDSLIKEGAEKTKTCAKCNRELNIEEFYRHPKCRDGYSNVCRYCKGEALLMQRNKNKELKQAPNQV